MSETRPGQWPIGDGVRPFDAVRRALSDDPGPESVNGLTVRVDPDRRARTGIPEIVLAGKKSPDAIVEALARLARRSGRAMATRCDTGVRAHVLAALARDFVVVEHPVAGAVVVAESDAEPPVAGGMVGILTAGSSDHAVAAEAALVAREMGCRVETVEDVGVAGLHRLVRPLEELIASGVDALVVVAGMDGALPSVVAGLVAVPVIGVPTSTGYGMGGDGTAALLSMLQGCAPGLTVVNIDNGVGAGAAAARFAIRIATARSSSPSFVATDQP